MSTPDPNERSLAERSVAAQDRYVVPVLVVVAVLVTALAWGFGGIPWWIAVPVLVLGVLAIAQRLRARGR